MEDSTGTGRQAHALRTNRDASDASIVPLALALVASDDLPRNNRQLSSESTVCLTVICPKNEYSEYRNGNSPEIICGCATHCVWSVGADESHRLDVGGVFSRLTMSHPSVFLSHFHESVHEAVAPSCPADCRQNVCLLELPVRFCESRPLPFRPSVSLAG